MNSGGCIFAQRSTGRAEKRRASCRHCGEWWSLRAVTFAEKRGNCRMDAFADATLRALKAAGPAAAIPDEHLRVLDGIFGPMLERALELVDRRAVVRVEAPSGRGVYVVKQSTTRGGGGGGGGDCVVVSRSCPCADFAAAAAEARPWVSALPAGPSGRRCLAAWLLDASIAAASFCALLQCKHLLAVSIADAMGCYATQAASSDEEVARLLVEGFNAAVALASAASAPAAPAGAAPAAAASAPSAGAPSSSSSNTAAAGGSA